MLDHMLDKALRIVDDRLHDAIQERRNSDVIEGSDQHPKTNSKNVSLATLASNENS